LLKRELGKGIDFQTFLNLADLYVANCDWAEAREQLDYADSFCGGSMLKRAKVTARRGLICYRSEEHAEAVKNFRQALLVKPGNLTLRSNLGNALLQLKKFKDAKDEFARVLKLAPKNIDALLGAAEVSIELAGDSDPDQFQIGVDYLSDAIEYGWNRPSGSKCLSISETAKIYYVRGYARTKSYEADASLGVRATLTPALNDFRQCKQLDPKDSKAPVAIEKITKFKRRRMRESWLEVWGPLVISIFGAIVFLFVQLDFFFPETLLRDKGPIASATEYGSLTFGSLLFMIAGLCLPQVLKLKLVGIELDKASVYHVSLPSTLGISSFSLIETGRSGSLPKF